MGKPGRPTKCTPELLVRAQRYIDGEWRDDGIAVYPSVLGMAIYLKVSRKVIWEWCGKAEIVKNPIFKRFRNIVKEVDRQKEHYLSSLGASGKLSPKITSLLLSQCGVIEIKQRQVTGGGGGPVKVETKLPAAIEELIGGSQ